MGVSSSNKRARHMQNNLQRCSKLVNANYCIPGMMSRCSAGAVWENQKKCRFSKKSTSGDRCMHYIIALDGHCDSVDAQRED